MGTVRYSEFLGVDNGKAYLKLHSMSAFSKNWSETLYWLESRQLDAEFLQSLQNNKP